MAGADLHAVRPDPSRPRLPDWPERLAALVEARRETPFAWGAHDCCSWAADAALEVCGADPLASYRGTYASEAEAAAIIGPAGLEAFVEGMMAGFGAGECPPAFAQRGDWALVEIGNETACGVMLAGVVAVPGLDKMRFAPLRTVRRTWAI